MKAEKAQTDLIDDLDSKQNDLRQARLQVELFKSTKNQLEQAQDQNQRFVTEEILFLVRRSIVFVFRLQNEIANKNDLIAHQERQIVLLERQIASRGNSTS